MTLAHIIGKVKRADQALPDLKRKPSLLVMIFAICFSFWLVDLWKPYNQANSGHNFYWDVMGYYSYLPAYFCNHGSMELPTPLADYNPPGPIGKHVPKYTYGLAAMYAPFFGMAYKIAYNQHSPLDGFSEPFVTLIHVGCIFYVLLGLFFLRSYLLNYFSEKVTAITLATVFFGSMLFFYTYVQGEMTHGYLFCLFSIFLWLTERWHKKQTWGLTFWLGFIIGLIALIRPTEVFIFLLFIFWNVKKPADFKTKFFFFLKLYPHLILIAVLAMAWWIPQLMFYKVHAGRYFYFSYMRERFFWTDPQIINVLFSYRKGWITYTPIVALAFVGFFFVKKEFPLSRWTFFGVTALILYVLSCWWDWNYGGCFAARSFCQQIAILAVPLAYFIEYALNVSYVNVWRSVLSVFTAVFLCSCICLSIGMSYQYNTNKKIHPWGTSKTIYWKVIRTYQFPDMYQYTWYSELIEPDFLKYSDGSDRDH